MKSIEAMEAAMAHFTGKYIRYQQRVQSANDPPAYGLCNATNRFFRTSYRIHISCFDSFLLIN